MKTFQGDIRIRDGKIVDLNEHQDYVRVVVETVLNGFNLLPLHTNEYLFDNCTAYPGFVDAHGHLPALGEFETGLNLKNFSSAAECAFATSRNGLNRCGWTYGFGWNQQNWDQKVFPDRGILDYYLPDTPVYLLRVDCHAAWVNSEAMRVAGITERTCDPDGGKIIRDKSGYPTGILIDEAMKLVSEHIPHQTEEELSLAILSGCQILLSNGITEICEMDTGASDLSIYRKLNRDGRLPLRVNCYLRAGNEDYINYCTEPWTDGKLSVVGLKFFIDGALGSRGAALKENYSDAETKGELQYSYRNLYDQIKCGIKRGFNIAVHAIGDAANELILEVFDNLRKSGISVESTIFRVEHAQVLTERAIGLFQSSKAHASIQPLHSTTDAAMARLRIGNRVERAYLWKTLLNAGIPLYAGSDFPIESCNPLRGIDSFVRCRPQNETKAWRESEILTMEEAISAYTDSFHAANKSLDRRGTIEIGKDADLTILDCDLYKGIINTNIDISKQASVKATVCDGSVYIF